MENDNSNTDNRQNGFNRKERKYGKTGAPPKKPDHFDNNPSNPIYSKPWIPNHPEYFTREEVEPPKTKHLFTIHLGAWAKFIRDVVATILMIKLMSAL